MLQKNAKKKQEQNPSLYTVKLYFDPFLHLMEAE